jgi:hypothetical protein
LITSALRSPDHRAQLARLDRLKQSIPTIAANQIILQIEIQCARLTFTRDNANRPACDDKSC